MRITKCLNITLNAFASLAINQIFNLIEFAAALTNPMKYLSEKEQRAKKLEVFEMDDENQDGAAKTDKPENGDKPGVSG